MNLICPLPRLLYMMAAGVPATMTGWCKNTT